MHPVEATVSLETEKEAARLRDGANDPGVLLVGGIHVQPLPVELLCDIFIRVSELEDLAPVKITAISRLWRRTILSTPRAWSRIWFHNTLRPKNSHRYITTFLERSHPVSLHVCLPRDLGELIYPLFVENLHRMQCLVLGRGVQVPNIGRNVFPQLTKLTILGLNSALRPSDITIRAFPRLETLDMFRSPWDRVFAPFTSYLPPLKQLSIYIDGEGKWLQVIQATSQSLEALRICGDHGYRHALPVVVDLPALRSLRLSICLMGDITWPLRATTPALTSYNVSVYGQTAHGQTALPHSDVDTVTHLQTTIIPDLSVFPALRVLQLEVTRDAEFSIHRQLHGNQSICPQLEIIEIVLESPFGKEELESIKWDVVENIRKTSRSIRVIFLEGWINNMPYSNEHLCRRGAPCEVGMIPRSMIG